MANGFKLSGGSYVSKLGNNSNSGLTDALPKQTITAGLSVGGSSDVVVLSGVYREAITLSGGRTIVGDGVVKIVGNGSNTINVAGTSKNVTIQDFATYSNTAGTPCYDTIFKNIPNYDSYNYYDQRCIYINLTVLTSRYNHCSNSLLFNTIFKYGTHDSNYIDSSSEIVENGTSSFVRCNFRGKYTKLGVSYCVPTGSDITISGGIATVVPFASRTGSYPSGCSDWLHVGLGISATQCYVTNGNFNADPQFVDMFNEDFSVLPTSPMIGKGTGGTNIGNVKVTNTSLRKTATQFTSKNNLSGTSDLSVEPSNTTGEWLSEVITIDALNPRVFMRPTYVGNLSFEKGQTGNTANINDNVPWVASYTKNGTTITNTSPRPCVLVRFSNKNSMPNPAVDSDWDNGNNNTTTVNGVLPGEYFLAELNADFKYDANGFGNADTNFNVLANSQLAAKYCMYKVILTDLY